ncbi:glucokinase, partial [Salmonella enterica subsp. enterica serovar Lubbock]
MNDYTLVGDIGGTNARFALVRRGGHVPEQIRVLATNEFANLDTAISHYLKDLGIAGVDEACVAIAGPVQRETLQLTNSHWCFTRAGMRRLLGFTTFKVINDFTAMALGVPHVETAHLVTVGHGSAPVERAPRLVIGPGTGLGVAGLLWARGVWIALAS